MRIRVPATSANLGPGFDTLGMALQFYNYFEATPASALSVRLSPHTCVDVAGLSLDPSENLLAKAYQTYFEFRQTPLIPAKLVIEAHVPLSRGMGSSSSAIVAGIFLADSLHPEPLGKEALLPWAITLEGHPDNVVPAMLGGVRGCLSNGHFLSLTWPEAWGIILVIPPLPLSTEAARAVMPSQYAQADVVENLRAMAAWIYAIEHSDPRLFAYALASDTVHQPARGPLIPEFSILQKRMMAHSSEAIGCVISGSGSTLAVYTPSADAQKSTLSLLKNTEALSHCTIIPVRPDVTGVCEQAKRSADSA